MGAFGSNHKTFFANFIDPLGFFGGKKGFLGLGEDKNKVADREAADAAARAKAAQPPSVQGDGVVDEEALKRVGRAQLISSSPRGVLNNAETSNKKLFGVQ